MDALFLRLGLLRARDAFFDVLFPRSCYRCGAGGSYLCAACFSQVKTFPHPLCPHCGTAAPFGELRPACRNAVGVRRVFNCAAYQDDTVQCLVRDFKYKRAFALADPLAGLAYWWFAEHGYLSELVNAGALVVPVPSHKHALRERGFNHAEKLARAFAKHADLSLACSALVKIRSTPSQVSVREREKRLQNVVGAFLVTDEKAIRGRTVLLVDDVITTGATLKACARVLRGAGARQVWAFTIAKD
jgi:ComF family protein